jgi:hypothetical protein
MESDKFKTEHDRYNWSISMLKYVVLKINSCSYNEQVSILNKIDADPGFKTYYETGNGIRIKLESISYKLLEELFDICRRINS